MYRIFTFPLLLISSYSFAQIKVSGKITGDKKIPLQGVSVSIVDSYNGATTDSAGNYSFTTSEKGAQTLKATASGYKPFEEKINLPAGRQGISSTPIILNTELKEAITELKAVVISAGTFEASDAKRATALNPIDIVTTASANGDITAALKTLPGTQQVGESEGLFVRGGTADETKYFIDGTQVNNFYYSSEPGQATRGRFNPFLFKGTIFSSGGYSALYGQALSSVLLLESIDLPEKTSASFGISYLNASAGIQKLSKNKKFSWGATYSYTNLSLVYNLIKQKFDYFQVPIIHQADANFRIKTSSTGMLKYYGTFTSTNVGFRQQDVDSLNMKDAFGLKNLNMYHNLSWKEYFGDGWKVNVGTSYSTNKDNINMEFQNDENQKQELAEPLYAYKNFNLINKGQYANAKVVFEKKLKSLSAIRFGTEDNYSNEKSTYNEYNGTSYPQNVKENIISGFGEADIYVSNNIAARVGVRAEHSKLLDAWDVAPRISFAYKLADKSQFSLAYGTFYQDPDRKYLPSINALHFQKATHYILQYEKMVKDRTFRTELFYKKYNDLLKTTGANNENFTAINNNGFGDAKGIEFFWRDKKTFKNFDYWISYSYLDTKRDFLNYPFAIEPSYVSKHTASLVVKKFVMPIKTQLNMSYTFASGRPYYDIVYNYTQDKYSIMEQGRTKDYNNLSLSINYLPSIGKTNAKAFSVFVFSVTNILGFNNVYNYNFSVNGQNKVAVAPPSKRFIYLGYFVSLGIDR
ncbi:MAG: carboxypeptidase-like regulatory domain-containing protein, partial [Ginsengibacter sp.]